MGNPVCEFCGRKLTNDWGVLMCPRHKLEYKVKVVEKPKRQKIGRWSGYSKNYDGFQKTRSML